jgi:hypothetical protein
MVDGARKEISLLCCIQLQIPAPGGRRVKLANVGKFAVECFGECLRFFLVHFKSIGIGEDDAFLVKAQVYRVGTKPVTTAGGVIALTEQTQGAKRCLVEVEALGERCFKGEPGLALAVGMAEQPFKAGGSKLAKGELVGRFGPDKFGDEQSQAHGGLVKLGRGRPKSVP